MKLTNEDKVQIYELRNQAYSFKRLSNQFEANIHSLKFIKSKDKNRNCPRNGNRVFFRYFSKDY